MRTTTTEPSPFAFATAGEQAFDFAYEQIAKFRPGGANYKRLRALQVAGEALKEQPALYAAAPAMLKALLTAPLTEHPADDRGPCLCSQCQFSKAARRAIAKATDKP
ncbi:MAG TPA: hypothetical protein VFU31_19355 [Candidatus Binatia bacterium]|nr:hypothetical protein [Candidatus Binatia bacterium]